MADNAASAARRRFSLTGAEEGPLLSTRGLRLRRTAEGIELYHPPLRMLDVALPLAVFGALALGLPALGAAALLPRALADAAGALTLVLIIVFIGPFALFGAALVLQAIYMFVTALRVQVDAGGVRTVRFVLGMPLPARRFARSAIASVEPLIVSRHQSLFSAEPLYQLVACNAARTRRIVVAEGLRGEALMTRVQSLVESALDMRGGH